MDIKALGDVLYIFIFEPISGISGATILISGYFRFSLPLVAAN